MKKMLSGLTLAVLLFSCLALPVWADQIQMKNGDVLNGSVLSLSSNVLVLKNENFGIVKLQRSKVVTIRLSDAAATGAVPVAFGTNNPARPPARTPPGDGADLAGMLRGIRADSNLVQQVQARLLGGAGDEANAKFSELMDGLSTGKIDMNGLRAEAKNAADQLRAQKKGLGPEAGDELDGYLSILDAFLRETAPVNTTTNFAPTIKPSAGQGGH